MPVQQPVQVQIGPAIVIVSALNDIRRDVEPYGVPIPVIEEIEVGFTSIASAAE